MILTMLSFNLVTQRLTTMQFGHLRLSPLRQLILKFCVLHLPMVPLKYGTQLVRLYLSSKLLIRRVSVISFFQFRNLTKFFLLFIAEGVIPTDLFVIGTPNLNTNVSSSPLLISSCNDGSISLYDIEGSSTPVLSFEKVPNSGIIFSLAVHPTMPIVISAHGDRHIRLWDINTGIFYACTFLYTFTKTYFCLQANAFTQWLLILTKSHQLIAILMDFIF